MASVFSSGAARQCIVHRSTTPLPRTTLRRPSITRRRQCTTQPHPFTVALPSVLDIREAFADIAVVITAITTIIIMATAAATITTIDRVAQQLTPNRATIGTSQGATRSDFLCSSKPSF